MAMTFPPVAHALEWRFVPSLAASATYTDNVRQREDNPDNALVLTATPGFRLDTEGSRRVRASLQYGATGVVRLATEEGNDLQHNLNAVGKAELVEDFLFIDGTARISQELISLLGSTSDATINDENRATVGTYSISPYIQKRFGTFAHMQLRYTNSGAIFENQTTADTSANTFNASLASGTRFDDVSWGLNYSIRKAENRNGPDAIANTDTTLERASATVGYALTRKFRVFGTVGDERNDYFSTNEIDGSFYSAGFGWSPTRRTSLEASVGERFFGQTYSVSGSHRTRLSQWRLRYYEDVSDVSQQFLDESARLYFFCLAAPTFREVGDLAEPRPPECSGPYTADYLVTLARQRGYTDDELIAARFPTSIVNGIFVIKSLTASTTWDIRRWGFGVSAQDTRRLYQALAGAEDHLQGVSSFVRYRISPRTTASSGVSVTRTTMDSAVTGGTKREDDAFSFNAGLSHRFGKDLTGALTFRHSERDSNAANANYTENALTASVILRF